MEENKKQLVILGNGFDLSCGLKSDYVDFFKWVREIKHNKNNFWYSIFNKKYAENLKEENPKWSDIEHVLLETLVNIQFLYSNSLFITIGEELNWRQFKNKISVDDINYIRMERFYSISGASELEDLLLNKHVPPINELFDLLKIELSQIEKDFTIYLLSEVNKFESSKPTYYDYSLLSTTLLFYINAYNDNDTSVEDTTISNLNNILSEPEINLYTGFEKLNVYGSIHGILTDKYINHCETSVLSFNYTYPTISTAVKIRNIHGSLEDENIIFGIDYDTMDGKFKQDKPLQLSKTFRILETKFKKSNDVIINKNLDYIKIFGHSLSVADYSYFQALFDTVDLYNSNVVLIFFWSDYNNKKREKIFNDFISNVTQLIKKYGTYLKDNVAEKNIFTKLQLENRLRIREIPVEKLKVKLKEVI